MALIEAGSVLILNLNNFIARKISLFSRKYNYIFSYCQLVTYRFINRLGSAFDCIFVNKFYTSEFTKLLKVS